MAEPFEKDRKIFLESFPGEKCFQTFDDIAERKSRKLIYQKSVSGDQYVIDGEIDPMVKPIPVQTILDIEARNAYGACCSLTINETNGRGRKTTDVIKVRSVWADFDGVRLPNKWDYKPSMIIETSPGRFHAYWFTVLDNSHYETPLKAFTPLQEGVAKKFNSDKFVKDLPKAMRMPGFYHCKGDRFLSRVVDYTGDRFEFGLLVSMFPPIARETWSSEKYKQAKKLDPNSEYKGSYGAGEGGRNHHIAKRVGGMLNRGLAWPDVEQEAYREAAACNPPLSEAETRAILKSMRRYS